MEFTVVKFFAYNIRSTVIDSVRMFLVSDLLNQYNENHNTNKQFYKYLQNQQTQELLISRQKTHDLPNSAVVCQSDEKYTGGQDPDLQCQSDKTTGLWDIDGVIKYVSFSKVFGTASQGYVICEELLIACLMWADPVFAWDVYTFLKECREKNNDFLKKEVRQLKVINKTLRTRYIPNDEDSQWTYILTLKDTPDNIILRSRYVHQTLKGKKIEDEKIYYVKNLPNGYIFKLNAYNNLLPVIDQYGGKSENMSTFIIPKASWNADHRHFTRDIRAALKQTRVDLCWRTDLELDEDIEDIE